MKVAALQHDIVWADPLATQARLVPQIVSAVGAGAELIVLAEMYSTGFTLQADLITESMDGPSVTFLRDQAQLRAVWLMASVAVRDEKTGRPRNRFIAAGPGGELFTYDKRHPFTFAGEDREFERGDELLTFTVHGLRITPFVCYDLRFGDEFWRAGPDTDVFIVPANWPEPRRRHWMALLVARAIENQCYVIGVNRVGRVESLNHVGDSMVVDPAGEVLAAASHAETLLLADVTSERVSEIRSSFPVLQDRR